MAQQTAVEWLVSKQKHNKFFNDEIIEQAKKIEKKQIIAARIAGDYFCDKSEAEEYYNEAYNQSS